MPQWAVQPRFLFVILFKEFLDDVVQDDVPQLLFGVLFGLDLVEDVFGLGF
jgi:hypothetical protein